MLPATIRTPSITVLEPKRRQAPSIITPAIIVQDVSPNNAPTVHIEQKVNHTLPTILSPAIIEDEGDSVSFPQIVVEKEQKKHPIQKTHNNSHLTHIPSVFIEAPQIDVSNDSKQVSLKTSEITFPNLSNH